VSEELARSGELDEAGGPGYVHSLPGLVPAAGRVAHYGRIVREHAQARRLLTIARQLQDDIYGGATPADALDTAERGLYSVAAADRANTEHSIEERQEALVAHVERGEADLLGSWPFADLNRMTGWRVARPFHGGGGDHLARQVGDRRSDPRPPEADERERGSRCT
jgi:replicative DNA helicase